MVAGRPDQVHERGEMLQCKVLKELLGEGDGMPVSALPPFEHIAEEEEEEDSVQLSDNTYQTIFEDHNPGKRT